MRSKSKCKDKVAPLKIDDGTVVTDSAAKCEILNKHFSTVFTVEDNLMPEIQDNFSAYRSYQLTDFVVAQVLVASYIRNLPVNKAPGVDGIAGKLLVETIDIISNPLSLIFQKSI